MSTTKTPQNFSLISRRKLLALYGALVRCRVTAELAGARGAKRPLHEAPAVAVALDLKPGDTIGGAERDILPAFAHGAEPLATLSMLSGDRARPGAAFSAMLTAALAAAREHARKKDRRIAAVFARGNSASSVAWRNALQAAGKERLPILFVSRSGATQLRGARQTRLGFPAIAVDADDAIAIYRVAAEAQAHARRGNGPTLIECVPWPAAVPQDGARAINDPVRNMERYLEQMRIPFAGVKRKVSAEIAPGAKETSRRN